MTPIEIKQEITKRRPEGLTQSSIARQIGVTKQAVLNVIEKRNPSRRIAQAVADAIERPLFDVFPEYCKDVDNGRSSACR
jgi:DNA-binding XRE family transcriptional regulator